MSDPHCRIGKVRWKTAEVIVMPGVERRDLVGSPVPSERVLRAAIELGVTDVVVLGRHRDGSRYVAGETNDADRTAGILSWGVWFMARGIFEQGMRGGQRE